MKTPENLQAAFAGESQANRRYLAFAKQAEQEGYQQVAKLFRAIAEAETIHAHSHLRTMGMIKSTAENLQAAIDGETYEYQNMYPGFLQTAQAEGDKAAERSFHAANEAEKVHAQLYKEALDNLGKNASGDYYVCPICGHVSFGAPPDKCPICNASGAMYKRIS